MTAKQFFFLATLVCGSCLSLRAQTVALPMPNSLTGLMAAAKAHAAAHGAPVPLLSPQDVTVLGVNPQVDIGALHAMDVQVVPWTTNDPEQMRKLIALHVDGLISDRPDLLQQVLAEERTHDPAVPVRFDVSGHRGARGLRPENTLPAFETGLDHLITRIETDTGVTRDRQSIIWHDQFLNPESCRRVDGKPYTLGNAVFHRERTLAELQRTFVCDKLHAARFPDQRNDPKLSPVAVAFARREHLRSPYSPISVDQLFRFAAFYAAYYESGPGRAQPEAMVRADNAARVSFNLETKILPLPEGGAAPAIAGEPTTNHTVDPQTFVTVLCGTIVRAKMQARADVQSFDFRTLQLVEEQFPAIPTYYLTGDDVLLLSTEFVPVGLRQPAAKP